MNRVNLLNVWSLEGLGMNVICTGIWYEKGEFELAPSYSSDARSTFPRTDELGMKWEDRGTGWAQGFSSSKLILFVEVDGEKKEIWIDRFFKNRIGRLTKKRRDAILKTMPESVEVQRVESKRGTVYFTVLDNEMESWLGRVEQLI